MSYISYTVERNLIERSFAITSVVSDIDVNASAQSFKSTTTDLSGLNPGDTILTAGFSTTANNGYMRVEATSSATQVLVSSLTSTLVDETTASAVTMQEYKYAVGDVASLEFTTEVYDRQYKVKKIQHTAIGGNYETIHQRDEYIYQVRTNWIEGASALSEWEQWWWSVSRGESFTFDFAGTSAVADNAKSVQTQNDSMQLSRVDTSLEYYNMIFTIKEL